MAVATSTLLAQIESAIEKALAAQAYTVRQREVKRANLKELFDARRELLQEIQAESAGSQVTVAQFHRST
tara:strand:- start:22627 stop:22836 length:210 start_codon:yes stop_codon:yes gene_type:complete